jgi:hypothetical protein
MKTSKYLDSDYFPMGRYFIALFISVLCIFCLFSCNAEADDYEPIVHREPVDTTDTAAVDGIFYEASVYARIDGIGKYQKHSAQGFAAYNHVGFCFYDTGYCQTIDLNNKSIISSFKLPGDVANPLNHCGVACFSNYFFDKDDTYPLLYLSSYKELKCYVLRLTETNAELIQEIQMIDEQGNIIPVYAFMPDGDVLLLKTNRPSKQNNGYSYQWKVAKRPAIKNQKKAHLTPQDIIHSFTAESSDAYNAGFCQNGKIYQIAGYHGYGTKKLYIIDYVNATILKEIIWEEPFLYEEEHEQCTPYGEDGMLINYNGADYISYIKFTYWKY